LASFSERSRKGLKQIGISTSDLFRLSLTPCYIGPAQSRRVHTVDSEYDFVCRISEADSDHTKLDKELLNGKILSPPKARFVLHPEFQQALLEQSNKLSTNPFGASKHAEPVLQGDGCLLPLKTRLSFEVLPCSHTKDRMRTNPLQIETTLEFGAIVVRNTLANAGLTTRSMPMPNATVRMNALLQSGCYGEGAYTDASAKGDKKGAKKTVMIKEELNEVRFIDARGEMQESFLTSCVRDESVRKGGLKRGRGEEEAEEDEELRPPPLKKRRM